MNYRHAFHAGNFADVVKHVTVCALLEHLSRKDKPWCYVETHAGRGRYDLDSPEARRSGEWRDGIGRLADAPELPAAIVRYLRQVRDLAGNERQIRVYPGSPLLARAALRPGDRALLAELQPDEAAALRAEFRGEPRVAVHHMDGYQALKALLPPTPRRGLVLIDPPYEAPDELARLPARLGAAARRWPTGIFVLWYPIKDRRELAPLRRGLERLEAGELLFAELSLAPADNAARMNGSGLAIVRPPWRFEDTLRACYPALARCLARATVPEISIRRVAAASDARVGSGA
jgi:23S rRNA (adenine2030-N6)-methyltransferase